MSKAVDIAKVSTKGSFHALWGLATSTVILSVGTILVARLLGSDLYGLYTVVLTPTQLIALFVDWGITTAIIHFTAKYRVEGRTEEIRGRVGEVHYHHVRGMSGRKLSRIPQ